MIVKIGQKTMLGVALLHLCIGSKVGNGKKCDPHHGTREREEKGERKREDNTEAAR